MTQHSKAVALTESEALRLKVLHQLHAEENNDRIRRVRERLRHIRAIRNKAEGGKVAVIWSGRDCDGVQYSGDVSYITATKEAVDEHIEHTYEWADGPCYFYLERPSVAALEEYESRDLTLEAYEDGHPWSIHA